MLECCFKLYLSDIFEKNKTDNIRSLSEHSFFALLNLLNDNDDLSRHFLALAAQEIIRYFANIPSLQKAFRNFAYPASLDLRAKVYILTHLIQGMSEVAEFKNLIGSKSDKIQQLTRRRGDLIAQLKKD